MEDNINKEFTLRFAEENDVDLLLDMKLDIILNNEKVLNMDKNELEKTVLEAEEQIRENLADYRLILNGKQVVGFISIGELDERILIDCLYVMKEYRNNGVGTKILKEIISNNYKPIDIYVERNNEQLIDICKNVGFSIKEDLEDKFFMKHENNKEENKQIKAEILCREVSKLCEKYKVKYLFYTENKSISNINDRNFSKQINKIIDEKNFFGTN